MRERREIKYRGYTLVHAPIRVPGGNALDAYKIVGSTVHAPLPTCKEAIDKAVEGRKV